MKIAIDTTVLVGLFVPNDTWHLRALALFEALEAGRHKPVFFDCVMGEALSVAIRRLYEKHLTEEVEPFLDRVESRIPSSALNWLFPDVPRLYGDILALIRQSGGELNFNDALIALGCRERAIEAIASFDADFDRVPWLHRVAEPDDLARTEAPTEPSA